MLTFCIYYTSITILVYKNFRQVMKNWPAKQMAGYNHPLPPGTPLTRVSMITLTDCAARSCLVSEGAQCACSSQKLAGN